MCPRCCTIITGPPDPEQLALFPLPPRTRAALVANWREEFFYTLAHQASQATKQKYPYH